MKASILLPLERPKASREQVKAALEESGIDAVQRGSDFGVAVGGDGVFGYFGRTQDIPLLFVGVRSDGPTGSKAFMAEVDLSELASALKRIKEGKYRIAESKRLEARKNGKPIGEIFTDVYLERGSDSNSLRYELSVTGEGLKIEESAIGGGAVVCTRAGSTGYFSYVDKLRRGDWLDPSAHRVIGAEEVGVCHILPSYTSRKGLSGHPLRYTVPWGCQVSLALAREADARLYGVGSKREGMPVGLGDEITIIPSAKTTKLVKVSRT